MGMASLASNLNRLLKSLPPSPPQAKFDELVKKTLLDTQEKSSPENRKSQWEYLLKNAVFDLAVRLHRLAVVWRRLKLRSSVPRGRLSKRRTPSITVDFGID
jgi:hypothetical protein